MPAMNYSNVSKPNFYIPWVDWLHSIGYISPEPPDFFLNGALQTAPPWDDIHLLNPFKAHTFDFSSTGGIGATGNSIVLEYSLNRHLEVTGASDEESAGIYGADGFAYVFVLGHNLEDRQAVCQFNCYNGSTPIETISARTEIQNDGGNSAPPEQNGFSIIKQNWLIGTEAFVADDTINRFSIGFQPKTSWVEATSGGDLIIGSVSVCTKWTPPHSPDLALTMSREFDGVKNIETHGGATLSNAAYTQVPWFAGGIPAWELGGGALDSDEGIGYRRSRHLGRRTWDLQFSYVSDSDLMPKSESYYYYGFYNADGALHSSVQDGNTINASDTFFAQVLNRVQGSHLPFIFQPDSNNTNPDQWAICRFDQDSFEINQVANNVYNISLKIRECW